MTCFTGNSDGVGVSIDSGHEIVWLGRIMYMTELKVFEENRAYHHRSMRAVLCVINNKKSQHEAFVHSVVAVPRPEGRLAAF